LRLLTFSQPTRQVVSPKVLRSAPVRTQRKQRLSNITFPIELNVTLGHTHI